jgi:MFS transporter, ACS family, tartrate transporter
MPFLFLLYLVAYLDRVNLGFAGLRMTRELGFSDAVFGLGSGIFFIGYCLLEIPGALLVEMWSARKWLARIMITWGFLAAATAWIRTPHQFYWVRFFLGVAEAGFFPGVVVYLSHWYRKEDRGKATALFMMAIPASQAVGAPLSAVFLRLNWLGLSGWRWLLILEGLPAVVLGIVTLFYLTDRPHQARWLPAGERDWLEGELKRETVSRKAHMSVWKALGDRNVLLLCAIYFLGLLNNYGLSLWLPKIVQRLSALDVTEVSLLCAIPYILALPLMVLAGWHTDRTGERRWHTGIPRLAAGAALAAAAFAAGSIVLSIVALSIAVIALYCAHPPFWPMPTMLLGRTAAAASIGMINSFGNLGGFVGPYVIGVSSVASGGFRISLLTLAGCALMSGLLVALLRVPRLAAAET